jgi:hypothetical protein
MDPTRPFVPPEGSTNAPPARRGLPSSLLMLSLRVQAAIRRGATRVARCAPQSIERASASSGSAAAACCCVAREQWLGASWRRMKYRVCRIRRSPVLNRRGWSALLGCPQLAPSRGEYQIDWNIQRDDGFRRAPPHSAAGGSGASYGQTSAFLLRDDPDCQGRRPLGATDHMAPVFDTVLAAHLPLRGCRRLTACMPRGSSPRMR